MVQMAPILIAGPPRSGSTMTAALLIKHGVWIGNSRVTPFPQTNSLIGTENGDIKAIHKRHKNNQRYLNWATPLPSEVPEDPKTFKEKVLDIVDTDGKWLVKTAWLVIYWKMWNAAFPDARWVLLKRPATESANSVLRHPRMKKRGYKTAINFMKALQQRQKAIESGVHNSIYIETGKLAGKDHTEFQKLMRFCGIEPDLTIFEDFVNPEKWHGEKSTRN